jgi:hypothetical protein
MTSRLLYSSLPFPSICSPISLLLTPSIATMGASAPSYTYVNAAIKARVLSLSFKSLFNRLNFSPTIGYY